MRPLEKAPEAAVSRDDDTAAAREQTGFTASVPVYRLQRRKPAKPGVRTGQHGFPAPCPDLSGCSKKFPCW